MQLVKPLLNLLNFLAESTGIEELDRIREFCTELARMASVALHKHDDVESNAGLKRKRDPDEEVALPETSIDELVSGWLDSDAAISQSAPDWPGNAALAEVRDSSSLVVGFR